MCSLSPCLTTPISHEHALRSLHTLPWLSSTYLTSAWLSLTRSSHLATDSRWLSDTPPSNPLSSTSPLCANKFAARLLYVIISGGIPRGILTAEEKMNSVEDGAMEGGRTVSFVNWPLTALSMRQDRGLRINDNWCRRFAYGNMVVSINLAFLSSVWSVISWICLCDFFIKFNWICMVI